MTTSSEGTEDEALRSDGDPFHLLLAVQHADTLISQLEHRLATLGEKKELETAESALASVAEKELGLKAQRQGLVGTLKELERQVATIAARSKSLEDKMYASKGAATRELQAIDQEIHHLVDRRAGLEEQELELMIAQEPLDAGLSVCASERAVLEASIASLTAAFVAASRVVKVEMDAATVARSHDAQRLPTGLRDHYETLRARFGGTGAAALIGSRCDGCHLEMSSGEVDRIRHLPADAVVNCEQCGRILVRVKKAPR